MLKLKKNLSKVKLFIMNLLGIAKFLTYGEPIIKTPIAKEIIRLRDLVDKYNLEEIKVFDAIRINTPPPVLFPSKAKNDLISPGDYHDFPSIYIAKLDKAKVYSGTNLIFLKNSVICHDLYNFRQDYTSEELHGIHTLSCNFTRLARSNKPTLKEINIEEAASFNDACASNYAHWLTEVLPRIPVFCSTEQYKNVPLIVDAGLHPNIIESLKLIAGLGRKIIYQETAIVINVERLYVTSVCGYVPFGLRDVKFDHCSPHGMFSPQSFELLRKNVLPYTKKVSFEKEYKKIYFCRNSQARGFLNAKEIESIILRKGYEAVYPEKLSFLKQVALMNKAESVIGASGSAMANLIFSPSSTKCTIFVTKVKGVRYWYWKNMLGSKENIYLVLGKPTEINNIHSDFTVNPKYIKQVFIHLNR